MLNLSELIPGKTVLVDPIHGKERLYLGRIKVDDISRCPSGPLTSSFIIVTRYNGVLTAWRPSEYNKWHIKLIWKDVTDQCYIDGNGWVRYRDPRTGQCYSLSNYGSNVMKVDGMKVYKKEEA